MKLSVIVCTRNRSYAITSCLDSIAQSLAHAAPVDAEIIVIDNGSTDNTSAIVHEWAATCTFPVRLLFEAKSGLSAAQNRAMRVARGDLFVFTDDDCRLSKEYVVDLLRHDAADTQLVFRGGRVELGDPTDLLLTIKLSLTTTRWNRQMRSARSQKLPGCIIGCNMTMRRTIADKLGFFDERFGPGTSLPAGGETDYIYRAYLAGITIEYVPDMVVYHYHGRKTAAEGNRLIGNYTIAQGGLYAKYFFRHIDFWRPGYWTIKSAIRETFSGTKNWDKGAGVSSRKNLAYLMLGAMKYVSASALALLPLPGGEKTLTKK